MQRLNREPLTEHPAVDLSRLSPTLIPDDFFESLKALQVPCPWGDLTKGEGFVNEVPELPELAQIPHCPLSLSIGAGQPMVEAYRSIAYVDKFGQIIHTDVYHPAMGPSNYVQLDLNNPNTINLFGFRVRALMSLGVFTYDGLGVNFRGHEAELEAAQKLTDLLMPGGIIANDNLSSWTRRFEEILQVQFGFQVVKERDSAVLLQKPF